MTNINSNNGQIRRGSAFAEKIYEFVKQPDVKTIVEIGTWKGMGSTKCILDGIINSNKKEYEVFSFECNKFFHEEAKVNLGFLPRNFHLIHGTLFDYKELYSIRDDKKLNAEDSRYKQWIEEDISAMQSCKNVFDTIPNKIDLLILDGGEFSGDIEFKLLWKGSKYIFMDDTSSFKNKNNKKYVLENPDIFEVLYDDTNDRNCLICKNLKI